MKRIILLSLFILLVTTTPSVTGQTDSILVIYQTQSDLDYIDTNVDLSIVAITFDSLTTSMIDNVNAIILISSVEFSINEALENALVQHVKSKDTYLMVLTPFLYEFENTALNAFGITNHDDFVVLEETSVNWTIETVKEFSSYSMGGQFSYQGYVSIVETDKTVIANFTSTDLPPDEDEVVLPSPAIINATGDSMVYTIPTAITQSPISLNLGTDQLNDFISTILSDLVSITVEIIDFSPVGTDQNGSDTPQTDIIPDNPVIAQDINIVYLFIIILFAMLSLFYYRFLDLLDWLWSRSLGVLFAVVGVFYNVQDRSLDYNDIMMNNMRVEIIEYLDFLGPYGAYLRELKGQLDVGTGSLLWHLQVLEDFGMIEQFSIEGHTVFVSVEYINQFDSELKRIELNLKSKYILPIISKLSEYDNMEEIELSEIEGVIDTSRRTIRRILKKIEDEGLIQTKLTPSLVIIITDKTGITKLSDSLKRKTEYNKTIYQTTVTNL